MTTPARQEEADRVELVYYWALNQLANQTIIDSRELWTEVPASRQAENSVTWLRAAIKLVMTRRAVAQELAMSYYRLVRALRTGATIHDPGRDEDGTVSLEGLRDEFEAVVDDVDASTSSEAPAEQPVDDETADTPQPSGDPAEQPQYNDADYDEDDDILLEEIKELEALMEAEERAAEEEAANILDQLGLENLLKKLAEAEAEAEADQAEQRAQEAHDRAGKRQAAAAARIMMNAARGLPYSLAEFDGRTIGWARYSRTGTPCGFCAMLISRGVVYKNAKSAGSSLDSEGNEVEDQDKYHDNCRCVAVPIFLAAQKDSPLFELNRYYAQLWKDEIKDKGLGLTEWRRLLRDLAKQAQAEEQDNPVVQAAA